jgi:hypothetical protein
MNTDGELNWVVVVMREALDILAHRYDATLQQLVKHSITFLAIAEQHLARKDMSGRNRIWVQEEDVELWLASEPFRMRQRAAMARFAPRGDSRIGCRSPRDLDLHGPPHCDLVKAVVTPG